MGQSEKRKAGKRRYYWRHREREKAKMRAYYHAHKEELYEKSKVRQREYSEKKKRLIRELFGCECVLCGKPFGRLNLHP